MSYSNTLGDWDEEHHGDGPVSKVGCKYVVLRTEMRLSQRAGTGGGWASSRWPFGR